MIIIGAGGFAIELLEICNQLNSTENLVFFDNKTENIPDLLFDQFRIIKSEIEAKDYLTNVDNKFALGIGSPEIRKKVADLFTSLGGQLVSILSPLSHVGSYNTTINEGTCLMTGSVLTNNITVGKGCLINLNCTIGHDSEIGDYCELSPGTHISGKVTIGNMTSFGTGAVILPGIKVGANCIIGAGAVVTKDVPDNSIAMGIPAIIKSKL